MSATPGLDLIGMGSLGISEEDQKLSDYYWAMRRRGLEVAQNVVELANQWAEIQSIKQKAKADLKKVFDSAIPIMPVFDITGALALMSQIGTVYARNLNPALAQVDSLFAGPEDRMRTAGAMFGWLQNNLIVIAANQMEAIKAKVGFADQADSEILAFIRRYGPDQAQGTASAGAWMLRAMRAASDYMGKVAPDLKPALTDAVRIRAARELLLSTLDKSGIAAEYGIPLGDVDSALRTAGLGEPITIALIIIAILVAVAAGAVIYAITSNGAAAAKVGKNEIDRLKGLAMEEVEKIRADAAALVSMVAAEKDPVKRDALAKAGQSKLDVDSAESRRKLDAMAAAAKKNIDDARSGFDFTVLLWGGGALLAGFVGLKLLKVI